MPRFVILEHHWDGIHWDFMLEDGDVLKTWALDTVPNTSLSMPARASADHRLHYLTYEGEVSGGRGHVVRWDAGVFEWLGREGNELQVQLKGQKLRGSVCLKTLPENFWSFTYTGDLGRDAICCESLEDEKGKTHRAY